MAPGRSLRAFAKPSSASPEYMSRSVCACEPLVLVYSDAPVAITSRGLRADARLRGGNHLHSDGRRPTATRLGWKRKLRLREAGVGGGPRAAGRSHELEGHRENGLRAAVRRRAPGCGAV